MTYDQNEEWSKSDELYTKLIALDDKDAQAYNNFAYSLVERGEDLNYALALAKKAITISPNISAYLDTIGWIYYKLSEFEIIFANKKSNFRQRKNPAFIESRCTWTARWQVLVRPLPAAAVQTGRRGQRAILAGYASRADNNAAHRRLR